MTHEFIKFKGALYRLAATLQREDDEPEYAYWYIGDPDSTEYHPGDNYEPYTDQAGVMAMKSGIEAAWHTAAAASRSLGLDDPVVFLVDLEGSDTVARYMDGSHHVFLLDPGQHLDAHPNEIKLSLLHELGHAYLESWGRSGYDADEQDEEIVESFARKYLNNPTAAVAALKRNAEKLRRE